MSTKPDLVVPPRYSSPVTIEEMRAGDGARCIQFIQTRCRVTKTSIGGRARSLIRLRKFQQREIYRLLARDVETGLRKHRAGLEGVARKNGKSAKAAGIGLWMADESDPGGEIYICAADREQAGIIGNSIKAMIRMDPYLDRRFRIFKNEIIVPQTDTKIGILSAEAATKDGYNPTLVLFDEVHAQPDDELWDAMALGMGARIDPLMIGITTAGKRYDRHGKDTLCYRLHDYGKRVANGEIVDPSFYFAWWEPKAGIKANHLDPKTWAEANPGLGDLVSPEDLASVSKRTDEASFRTKRCNTWVSAKTVAIPTGKWEGRHQIRPRGQDLVKMSGGRLVVPVDWIRDSVGFLDGSWSGDSTGIVNCTRDGFLFPTAHYEKTPVDGPDWRVPVNSVKQDARVLFAAGMRVLLLDPHRWQQTASDLRDEGYPVVEWPTNSLQRIIPAWKDYYAAILDGELTHDGNKAMARHHENMVLKVDSKGSRPTKEHPTSIRHIDLAICGIGSYTNRHLEVEVERKRKPWVLTG